METQSSTSMKHWQKKIYYAIVLFGNVVINKLPSRHIRKWFYQMLGAKIGKSFLFRRAEVLFPKGIIMGDHSNVGWFTLLDARGGIRIGNNVSIASYAKLITGSHDIQDPKFGPVFKPIVLEDNVWICTGAIINQGVTVGKGAVVAAGAVVTKDVAPYTVVGGVPANVIGTRKTEFDYYPSTELLH